MPTFSLLLESPDQEIDRTSLEDASVSVRSIARADCARLHREMNGILVSGLDQGDAEAFHRALLTRNFPTRVVADADIPTLHQGFQIQSITIREEVLLLTDSMGRERVKPISDLVFIASGFVNRLEVRSETKHFIDYSGPRGGAPSVVTERELIEENQSAFRMDFFFWSDPHRLQWVLAEDSAIFHQGRPIRLRNTEALLRVSQSMAALLPPERLSIDACTPGHTRIHPNLRSYENGIRWHFHRLKRTA